MPRWRTERSGTTLRLFREFGPFESVRSSLANPAERFALPRSLDLEIFRRRLSAVAHDLELDLLTFVEGGQAGLFHSRNVNKNVLSATLRLNEAIALGRIEPLHSTGRHQSS